MKKILNNYKNELILFAISIVVTMSGFVFNKGDFYKYNYERQLIQDCNIGWYETSDKICDNIKERQKAIDNEDLKNDGKIIIPNKSPFDYVVFLSNILQMVLIGLGSFKLGRSTKEEKWINLWKFLDIYMSLITLTAILNFGVILVNGVCSSNDLLRFLFEISISIIVFIVGKKI